MVASPPYAAADYVVRVIPFESEWCVACKGGYYAVPLEKSSAVDWAIQLASELGLRAIAVCGKRGEVTEVIPVPGASGVESK